MLALELWGGPLTELNSRRIYFSQEGVLGIAHGNEAMYSNEEMSIASVLDSVKNLESRSSQNRQRAFNVRTESILNSKGRERWQELREGPGKSVAGRNRYDFTNLMLINLADELNQAALKQAFKMAGEHKIQEKEIAKAEEVSAEPQKILANL